MEDAETLAISVQQSSRPWNDVTDWLLYIYLFTHIDSDVDHHNKIHSDNAEAAENLDTNKLWIILRQSVNQHGTFNTSEIKGKLQTIYF